MPAPINQGLPAIPLDAEYPQLADVAANLLNFATAPSMLNPPVGAAIMWPGQQVAWDVPDGGLLWCRPHTQAPVMVAGCLSHNLGVLGFGILRCVAAMSEDGSPPPWADRSNDAAQLMLDAQILLEAILQLPKDFEVASPTWQSLGPQGGVAGGEWLVPVTLTA